LPSLLRWATCSLGLLRSASTLPELGHVLLSAPEQRFDHGDTSLCLSKYRPPGVGWFADNGSVNGDETYEGVVCLACRQVHMVNPSTGRVLGADEETN